MTAPSQPGGASLRDRLLFAAVLLASAVVLFTPSPPGPPLLPYADTAVHGVLFAALAWSGRRGGVAELPMGAALVAYAGASEIVQANLLADRSGSWLDVAADLFGATVGLLAARRRRWPT